MGKNDRVMSSVVLIMDKHSFVCVILGVVPQLQRNMYVFFFFYEETNVKFIIIFILTLGGVKVVMLLIT